MGTLANTTLANATVVLAPYALTKGSEPLITPIDLRTKINGFLKIAVGIAYKTAQPTYGVRVSVQKKLYHASAIAAYDDDFWWDIAGKNAAGVFASGHVLINNAGNYGVATTPPSFIYSAGGGTVPAVDTVWMFWGITTAVTSIASGATGGTVECGRVVSGATTPLILQRPNVFTHAHTELISFANVWEVPLEGGWLYDLIIDYKSETVSACGPCCAMAHYQSIDTYTSA